MNDRNNLTNQYRKALEEIARTAGETDDKRNYSAAGHLAAVGIARDALSDLSPEPTYKRGTLGTAHAYDADGNEVPVPEGMAAAISKDIAGSMREPEAPLQTRTMSQYKLDAPYTGELEALLREVLEADDKNVDTATTLPDGLTDRIRAVVNRPVAQDPRNASLTVQEVEQGYSWPSNPPPNRPAEPV